jgi:hypothetical protein
VHTTAFASLRRLAAAGLTATVIGGTLAAPALATGGTEFVSLTNVKRASVDLGPLVFSAAVDTIAVERGKQMAKADVLAHDLTYVTTRLAQLGICWTGVGEIIAWEKGYPTHSYQRTIDAWWASAGHHAIMVGAYTVAGGSWSLSATGATYSVMIFVKTCGGAVDTTAPTVVSRSPGAGAGWVSLTTGVSAGFSEQVRGVGTGTFVLRDVTTSTTVSASVSYDSTSHTAKLRLATTLRFGHWYRATLSSSIKDLADNPMTTTSWSFRASLQRFDPARSVSFSGGTHVGYKFSSGGAILGTKSYTLSRTSGASTDRRALVPTHSGTWYYVTNGVWAGYWMQASASVTLR